MYYLFDVVNKRVALEAYSLDCLAERISAPKSTVTSAYYRKTLLMKRYIVTTFYVDSTENREYKCRTCPLATSYGVYFGCPFDKYSHFRDCSCYHRSELILKFIEEYKPRRS